MRYEYKKNQRATIWLSDSLILDIYRAVTGTKAKVSIPQILEELKGVSFTWFSPDVTIQKQYNYLLSLDLDIDAVLLNSSQLAWYIQQNYESSEADVG